MTSTTFFIIFVPILAVLLLFINIVLAPHNPYQEKDSVFECGFHSFFGQNRQEIIVSFYTLAMVFLVFDLELVETAPFCVAMYSNAEYGTAIMLIFFSVLTCGFIFELGKNALSLDSRQTSSYSNVETPTSHAFLASASSNNAETSESHSFTSLPLHSTLDPMGMIAMYSHIVASVTPYILKSFRFINFNSSYMISPHSFVSKPLQSDMGISEIVTEINTLMPQLANFISQFNTTVIQSGVNVLTDATGGMSIDVPQNVTDAAAQKISTKIGIIDRLITTRGQEINDLLQKGISLENKLKIEDPNYVSQLTEKIQEFKRLNALYKH